jgi:hypothetical protein
MMMMMIRGIEWCPSDTLWGGGDMTPTSLRASNPFTLKTEAPVSSETSELLAQRHSVMFETFCAYLIYQMEGIEWQAFVNTIMNLRVTYKAGDFVCR